VGYVCETRTERGSCLFWVLIFNYQLTNLHNCQILNENATVCISNEYKILVIACIAA